jgi:hypothetical protein
MLEKTKGYYAINSNHCRASWPSFVTALTVDLQTMMPLFLVTTVNTPPMKKYKKEQQQKVVFAEGDERKGLAESFSLLLFFNKQQI